MTRKRNRKNISNAIKTPKRQGGSPPRKFR
uniref:Uncharacterized protein n=1 Tax=Rhizophora mucronata TaxID=61149 RepID=A0A2P2PWQ7_RHIMU